MLQITTKFEGNGVKTLQMLPGVVQKSANRAVKEAMTHMRAQLVRETVAKYYITAARIRKAMTISGTTLKVSGHSELIHHYKISPKNRGKKSPLVKAAVKRGGLKSLGNKAFLLKTGKGAVVMKREGGKRLPIRPVFGPAIPQIVGNEETIEALEAEVQEYFQKRMDYWTMRAIGAVKA